MPKCKFKAAKPGTAVPTTANRNKYAHAGWEQLEIAVSSGSRAQKSVCAEVAIEDAMAYISDPPSSNDVIKDEFPVIDDFDDDVGVARANSIRSSSPSSPADDQKSITISSPESPSCADMVVMQSSGPSPSSRFLEDTCHQSIIEDDVLSISSCSSPVAKNALKGSEWLQAFLTEQRYSHGDDSGNFERVERDVTSQFHGDGQHQRIRTVKGGIAESFERLLSHVDSDPKEQPRVTSLILTGVLNDVGQTAFSCREENPGANFRLSRDENLVVVFSGEVVKEFVIFSGRVMRIRSPWRTMRVTTLNTTFILSPVVIEVTSAVASDCQKVTLRWHCSCDRDSSCDFNHLPCRDGRLIPDVVDVDASSTVQSHLG